MERKNKKRDIVFSSLREARQWVVFPTPRIYATLSPLRKRSWYTC